MTPRDSCEGEVQPYHQADRLVSVDSKLGTTGQQDLEDGHFRSSPPQRASEDEQKQSAAGSEGDTGASTSRIMSKQAEHIRRRQEADALAEKLRLERESLYAERRALKEQLGLEEEIAKHKQIMQDLQERKRLNEEKGTE